MKQGFALSSLRRSLSDEELSVADLDRYVCAYLGA
jgi:hypothetical protein